MFELLPVDVLGEITSISPSAAHCLTSKENSTKLRSNIRAVIIECVRCQYLNILRDLDFPYYHETLYILAGLCLSQDTFNFWTDEIHKKEKHEEVDEPRIIYLIRNQSLCQSNITTHAAKMGHFEVLKWCNNAKWTFTTQAYLAAAGNGHFEVLKWLRRIGVRWHIGTAAAAARGGHLHILAWCVEECCIYY
jgi:hypothetical protein